MNYTQDQIDKVCKLKKLNMPHRMISQAVFGKRTAASSVHSILAVHYYPLKLREPRVLIFDIETSPILGYVWGLFNQNLQLDRIVEDWMIITWAAKWLGEGVVFCDTIANYDYTGGFDPVAEKKLVAGLWDLLDEADIVVAHNGDKFDRRKANAKFLEYGLGEPSPYKIVDTLKIARGNFAMTSNKLDYIAKFLTGHGKMEHEGFPLWSKFLQNDPVAQKNMLDYNIQDVHVLEEVYVTIRGWDKKAPNIALYFGDQDVRCPKCGGLHLTELAGKHAYTNLSQFQLMQCDSCGGYSRQRVNLLQKVKRANVLMNV